ncbi:hypothetical protein FACS1894186_5360 [Alphaproteobacteria bacterium]|nr:hypothetical protein FACS1894186_5360 [Alphaproteobacteria bacterium]
MATSFAIDTGSNRPLVIPNNDNPLTLITGNNEKFLTIPTNPKDLSLFIKDGTEVLGVEKALLKWKNPSKEMLEQCFLQIQPQAECLLDAELSLADMLKAIPTAQGNKDPKRKSRQDIIEGDLNLTKKQAEMIFQLTKEDVEEAKARARENHELVSRYQALAIKRERKAAAERKVHEEKKEQRRQEIFDKITGAKKAKPGDKFDVIYADLTVSTADVSISVPAADDAVLFLWTTSDKLPDALDIMKSWGFIYKDSAVWNRDIIKQGGDWVKNQYDLLLIGTRGTNPAPYSTFRIDSVYFEHKTDDKPEKPDYYYSCIENMCPGGSFLELFSCRKFSNKWSVLTSTQQAKV